MQCSCCQNENQPGAKFCQECGASLAQTCAGCARPLPSGAKFCPECGQAAPGVSAPDRFASPQRFIPKHLAERILLSKEALEGERKQVTVLFADLKGSMELLADRDPEEARAVLDPVLEKMIEAVHRYEGTVNQVMGDGIMALFGAPLALEDHAVRACYAALAMQSSLRVYGDELLRSHGLAVRIRVGLNSGEVVVRAIGSDLRMDYTAVGQTTHLAARMEQLADPGASLLTAATLQLVEGYVSVRPRGPVPVKGLIEAVEVYELTGVGAARSRLQAAALRGLSKFVGRTAEIAQLNQALERAQAGHGELVALVGEPGVGKSRVVWEFKHSHRTQGWLVLESISVSYGKASAYRPLIDLLKGYFEIEERDDARRIREKVAGKLLMLDRQLEALLSALLFLLGTPLENDTWDGLDPAQKRLSILQACKRLLLREAQVQPVMLVFEDLHWIDSETQAFLDSLVESLRPARVLLLINYRPEYQHRWTAKTYYTQLRIDPLAGESAEALLTTLLGTDPSLVAFKRLLIERTEGNPLFVEEWVRSLIETRELAGDRGAYRLSAPVTSIQVPATVRTILAARIDRLSPEEKGLLQAAAVIGNEVPYLLLQAVAQMTEEALRQRLSNLQAGEFLYETRLFPDLEYTFKHSVTHEVVYGSVLQERRRALHRRILQTTEKLYADRLTEQVERLAQHALRAEAWEEALMYLRQAGEKAFNQSANVEAVTAFEQALSAIAHLPQNRENIERGIDLRLALRNCLVPLAGYERALDYLRDAHALAQQIDDPGRRGWIAVYMTILLRHRGQLKDALAWGQLALDAATTLDDAPLRMMTKFFTGQAHVILGDYRHAIELIHGSLDAETDARGTPKRMSLAGPYVGYVPALPVLARAWLAWALAEVGDYADAIVQGEQAASAAASVDVPLVRAHGMLGLGIVHVRRGDPVQGVPRLESALQICREADIKGTDIWIAGFLGAGYILANRTSEAVSLLCDTLGRAGQTRPTMSAFVLSQLAQAYVLTGEQRRAVELAQNAVDLARRHDLKGYEAWSLYSLAKIYAVDAPSDAQASYQQALRLAKTLGMRPIEALSHLGLGELAHQSSQHVVAREELMTAAVMFRGMGMNLWVNKTEAALAELC